VQTILPYENLYRWFGSDGCERQVYWKHHPAPGEPITVGRGALAAVETPIGRGGGAICYDYDYAQMALQHARLGVDVVALPSSDWRGIDPIHAQMATLRAISGGFSLIRSTRFGLSVIVDPYGRIRARHSSFEGGGTVLIGEVPRHRLPTWYTTIGNAPVYLCSVFLLAIAAHAYRQRRSKAVRAQ
jgi:apolipoprotein N-acyltransferase